MKILIYVNKEKDVNGTSLQLLQNELNSYSIPFDVAYSEQDITSNSYDAVYVIGGDGTILRRAEYSNVNNIPIIGINAGKLGFLSEFEQSEIPFAVKLFAENKLKKDERISFEIKTNNETFLALNDVVIQRTHTANEINGMIVDVSVNIDGVLVEKISGDGVIIATPTGSTAYSLSAGGAILAPAINAFVITPLAAHSFNQRSVVFSADSTCQLKFLRGNSAGLFLDGKFIKKLDKNETIEIKKTKNKTIFLRRENSNFYDRLTKKIKQKDNY